MKMSDLEYKAYHHKFEIGSHVRLKDTQALQEVENNLLTIVDNNIDELKDITWYLSDKKKEHLLDQTLVVVNAISWHMGIPFYDVGAINRFSTVSHVAEFYLQKSEE